MSRRSTAPVPPERLAAILGRPSPAGHTSRDSRASGAQGWVPQRGSPQPPAGSAQTEAAGGRHRRPAPPGPALLTVPVALRGAAARPRRMAALGLLLLVVVVAVVMGVRVASARAAAQPQPVAASAHGPPQGLLSRSVPAAFASSGAPPTSLPSAASVLLVHVVGQVHRPGVVRLKPGARVLDAVTAAGGQLGTADLAHLNLARPVADGEQILVPKPGEAVAGSGGPPSPGGVGGASGGTGTAGGTGATGGSGAGPGGSVAGGGGAAGGLIDLNTADASALDSLPGVGPVLTQRILDWRAQHGRFSTVDELGEVSGIGDKLLAQISPRVKV